MNYLVDTHYLLWSIFEPQKIEKRILTIFKNEDAIKYVSKISFWELSLKYSLGKLELAGTTPEELFKEVHEAGFQTLDISEDDLISSYRLPIAGDHKDPFDRLLIWQCIRNNLTLITADKKIAAYKRLGLKMA